MLCSMGNQLSWLERLACTEEVKGSSPSFSTMRMQFNGRTSAFQADHVGSIPIIRSIIYAALVKWFNTHAFHACTHGFKSRTPYQFMARQRSWLSRLPVTQKITGSSPVRVAIFLQGLRLVVRLRSPKPSTGVRLSQPLPFCCFNRLPQE